MIGGRLFGENRAPEYSSTDLIDNPIMLLEYIKRHQNWEDNGGTALIKTGAATYGSFDDSSLDEIKTLSIARQISQESLCWTDALTKSICETFYLQSYQDENGYECVNYILRDDPTDYALTLSEIKNIGSVIIPKAEDVYIEPTLYYGYDYASGEYTGNLSIKGVTENGVWSSDLTPGIQDADASTPWYKCRSLYEKYRRVEPLPDNLAYQPWIPDYTTALWKLNKIISYMNYWMISLSVPYSVGRLLRAGMQGTIQVPNETNNVEVNSIITELRRNKSQNIVDLTFKVFDEVETSFYFARYQDDDSATTEWQQEDGASTEYQEGDA